MTSIQSLLTISSVYADAENVTTKTVSSRVFADAKRLDQLANGAEITVGRLCRALEWFSANWPDSADWPEGVARPFTSTKALSGTRRRRDASV